jgi:hypothetical protein
MGLFDDLDKQFTPFVGGQEPIIPDVGPANIPAQPQEFPVLDPNAQLDPSQMVTEIAIDPVQGPSNMAFLGPQEDESFLQSVKEGLVSTGEAVVGGVGGMVDAFTGEGKILPSTESLDDWHNLPEFNEISFGNVVPGLGAAFATMSAGPEEIAQIMADTYGLDTYQDELGNWIVNSKVSGKDYAIKPGFRANDIVRAIGTALEFAPASKVKSMLGQMVGGGATSLANEALQAQMGGTADPIPVAIDTAMPFASKMLSGAGRKVMGKKLPSQGAKAATEATGATPKDAKQLGDLVKRASSTGMGSQQAKDELVDVFATNPEAVQIFKELGIEAPADVLSDSRLIQGVASKARGLKGADQADWEKTVSQAISRGDELLEEHGAIFAGGEGFSGVSIASASNKLREVLKASREEYKDEAKNLYDEISKVVGKETPSTISNFQSELDRIIREVGESSISTDLSKALKVADNDFIPYLGLKRQKNMLLKAKKDKGIYSEFDYDQIDDLYKALQKDQLDNIERLGAEMFDDKVAGELVDKMKSANYLTYQKKTLEDKIKNAFGDTAKGGMGRKLTGMIKEAFDPKSGDPTKWNNVMELIPDDMPELRKELFMTAFGAQTRATSGLGKGEFGLSQFADMYKGMRRNPEVYAEAKKIMGPETAKMMQGLFEVSKRFTTARARVKGTGADLQGLHEKMLEGLQSENLITKILDSTVAKLGASVGGFRMGGPAGAGLLPGALKKASSFTSSGGEKAVEAAADLFKSDPFKSMVEDSAMKNIGMKEAQKLAASKQFNNLWKFIVNDYRLKNKGKVLPQTKEQWILDGLHTGGQSFETYLDEKKRLEDMRKQNRQLK